MESSPTLQDFILNLIYDPDARSAFELDPHGTLDAAGLGDVTAADVQDVLPLVLDYAPLANTPVLDGLGPVDDLTTGVAHLDVAGAVAHLQAITTQVGGLPSHVAGDLNLAAVSTLTVTSDHLASGVLNTGAGLIGHSGVGVTAVPAVHTGTDLGGLGVAHDPAAGLDTAVTTTAEYAGAAHGGTGPSSAGHTGVDHSSQTLISGAGVTGTLDATVTTVTGVTGSLGVGIDDLDVSGVNEATSSVVGAVGAGGLLPDGNVVDDATTVVGDTVSGVTGLVTGSAEPVLETGHDLLGGLTGPHF